METGNVHPDDPQASPAPDAADTSAADTSAAPKLETAEGHTGSDHVSHGANSNLTPAATLEGADAEAAREIEQQHQGDPA